MSCLHLINIIARRLRKAWPNKIRLRLRLRLRLRRIIAKSHLLDDELLSSSSRSRTFDLDASLLDPSRVFWGPDLRFSFTSSRRESLSSSSRTFDLDESPFRYNSFFLAHFRVRNIIDGESEEETGEDIDSEDSEDSGDSEDSEDSGGDDGDEAILEEGNHDGDGDDDDDSGSDDAPMSNGHPKVVPDGPYSVVQNNTQYAVDGTSEISQQPSTFTKQDHMLIVTSNCGSQSDQEGSEADKLKQEFLPIKDTHQAANFDAPPISYHDQCSIAASQQAMRLFRQQYPLNFYGPYFPPFYMPQPYIHHFLRPNGFQQQSYLPPGDDAPVRPGAKLHVPHIKSGSNIGSSPPTTFPSPYDSYTVAFNHILSAATVNSTHKEEKKENIYTTGPLSLANLQASAMYNLSLQGHPLQAGFTGISQQTQPILAAPTISAMTEQAIGLPRITNQQPQAALTNLDNNY